MGPARQCLCQRARVFLTTVNATTERVPANGGNGENGEIRGRLAREKRSEGGSRLGKDGEGETAFGLAQLEVFLRAVFTPAGNDQKGICYKFHKSQRKPRGGVTGRRKRIVGTRETALDGEGKTFEALVEGISLE